MGAGMTSTLTVRESLDQGRLVRVAVPEVAVERQFYLVHHAKQTLFPAAYRLMEELPGWLSQKFAVEEV
jgi:DNA-binding transcriptional LysR family regulator